MKKALWLTILVLTLGINLQGQRIFNLPPTEVERGPNHRVWQILRRDLAKSDSFLTNTYTEMRTGWHYWDNGRWTESSENITIQSLGASVIKCRHPVVFPTYLGPNGLVDLTTSEGQKLRSLPLALAYYDAASGKAVLLSTIVETYGWMQPPTRMVYEMAFTPVQADVRLVYSQAGLEQDVILRQKPPSPSDYGLDPTSTRLEVWTEFLSAPSPTRTPRILNPTPVSHANLTPVEPNFMDERLNFGAMQMVSGKAFSIKDSTNTITAPVAKQWLTTQGRTFLIEAVEYPAISNLLDTLPSAAPFTPGTLPSRTVSMGRSFPALARENRTKPAKIMAQNGDPQRPGLVIDYLLVNYSTNFTFKGDTTHQISGPVFIAGDAVFEGGTVLKYTNQAKLHLIDNVRCQTAPYRPAIFTSTDDDSVGVVLPSSTGRPMGYYAQTAVVLDGVNALSNVRFRNAQTAIALTPGAGYSLSHAQIVQCKTGLQSIGADISVRNVLFDRVAAVFNGSASIVRGEHLTVDAASWLNYGPSGDLYLTNSLLVAVTNYGPASLTAVATNASGAGVFQAAGAGAHYLPVASPYRNAGVTAIDPGLATALRMLTTEAPSVLGSDVIQAAVFEPLVGRDTDAPDLGYHYEPLDYVWNPVKVSGEMSWQKGVAMGILGSDGPTLSGSATLVSEGTKAAPNRLLRCAAVQEQPATNGVPNSLSGWLEVAAGSRLAVGFRFTEAPALGDGVERRRLFGGAGTLASFNATHSRFDHNLLLLTYGDAAVGLTNNILRRCVTELGGVGGGMAAVQFWNQLVQGGRLTFDEVSPSSRVYDNLFDGLSLRWSGAVAPPNDYNAYLGVSPLGTAPNDVLLDRFEYAAGKLGEFYQSGTNLVDAGSRPAILAGLEQFTTRATDLQEGGTTVDIGFHYPILVPRINLPPYIAAMADRAIDEMAPFVLPIPGGDANDPPDSLAYEILSAPAGAAIQGANFVWTPSEDQGPGTNTVWLAVRDNGIPSLSATQSFNLMVNEVNRAPVWIVPGDQTASSVKPLALNLHAVDPDIPANRIFYRIVAAPAGVALDPNTGAFTWIPTEAQTPGSYRIDLAAYDDGTPSMSATQSFNVKVVNLPSPYTTTSVAELDRGANYRQWQIVMEWQTAAGRTVSATNTYIERRSGWHYLTNGEWRESVETFTTTPIGGVADKGQHQLFLPSSIGAANPFQIVMANSNTWRGIPIALGYYDAASGRSVMLASNRLSTITWVSTNQGLYTNAFDSLSADVRYTYTRAGIEQDVILRQNPPSPADFGLDPVTTRLQVWTEFIGGLDPLRKARYIKPTPKTSVNTPYTESALIDEQLDFGPMEMVTGRAFATGGTNSSEFQALVAKRWKTDGGRAFLVEAVEYSAIRDGLAGLPSSDPITPGVLPIHNASLGPIPPGGQNPIIAPGGPLWAAKPGSNHTGLVIDFLLVNRETNFTFRSDTTYYLDDPVYLGGETLFEGGTVVKYGALGKLHLTGTVRQKTTAYRPVFFTARDDDTLGVVVAGSTSHPDGYYGEAGLVCDSANSFKHARFRYLRNAVALLGEGGHSFSHIQWIKCGAALQLASATAAIHNGLADRVDTLFDGYDSTVTGEHITVDQAGNFNLGSGNSFWLTNSLLVNVTNWGNPASLGLYAVETNVADSIFETAGAGAHYLPKNSPYRNLGLTNIDYTLSIELPQLTTEAPTVVSNDVTAPATYTPTVARDTDLPDLGYHYPPLDYIWPPVNVTANLTWTNGVAMGVAGGEGPVFTGNAGLTSQGGAYTPNRLSPCGAVQERLFGMKPPGDASGLLSAANGAGLSLRLENTEISLPSVGVERGRLVGGIGTVSGFMANNCRFDNLSWRAANYASIIATNNIFNSCGLTLGGAGTGAPYLQWWNNLDRGGYLSLGTIAVSSVVFENLFDGVLLSVNRQAIPNNGYNAYVGVTPLGGGTNDVVLNRFVYTNGYFGEFYQADTNLVDAGSRSARDADFYFTTTRADDAIEGSTTVDIGFHYQVRVRPTNTPPFIASIPDVTVNENSLLIVGIQVGDNDKPANHIALELLLPPAGASMVGTNLVWQPSEAQGPGAYRLHVVATDDGIPSLSATQSFNVVVKEMNQPPVINLPTNATVAMGDTLTWSNYVFDPDLPANPIAYRLFRAPDGAIFNTNTGTMTWTPSRQQVPGNYTFVVNVTDNVLAATHTQQVATYHAVSPFTTVSLNQTAAGPNHNQWRAVSEWTAPNGQKGTATNTYYELGTGLNYQRNGQWIPSSEAITSTVEGGKAEQGQHQVYFPRVLGETNRVRIVMGDATVLAGAPVALAYYDAASGRSARLAANRLCVADLGVTNRVVYTNAFDTLRADVRYTYTKAGIEQDVILRQNPPSPADFGLNPVSTRLEVWTEFDGEANPERRPRTIKPSAHSDPNAAAAEPNLVDEQIVFGAMRMVLGRAFLTDNATGASTALVAKRWVTSEGRSFLVEAVEYPSIQDALTTLPASGPIDPGSLPALPGRAASADRPPPKNTLLAGSSSRDNVAGGQRGLVIDFNLVNRATDFTFRGDATYHVAAPVFLDGKTVVEGGAVIKFSEVGSIHAIGGVQCQTAPYRPAFFTAADDNTVGVPLPNALRRPIGYYAPTALIVEGAAELKHLRFRYARTAATLLGGTGYTLSYAQLTRCETGIEVLFASGALRNLLFDQVENAISGAGATVRGEHWTVDSANWLNRDHTDLYLTNSLLVSVTNLGPAAALTAVASTPGDGVFLASGAGAHYLPANSPYRDAGTEAIDPGLAKSLRELTTEAPALIDGDIDTPATFTPTAARDTGAPDLGYHYEPLDYVWSGVTISASVECKQGVAVGVMGYDGPVLTGGASFVSEGLPQTMNRLSRCEAVQERGALATPNPRAGLIEIGEIGNPAVSLRFTEASAAGGRFDSDYLIGGGGRAGGVTVCDSRLDHLRLAPGSGGAVAGLTNNLWRRCELVVGKSGIETTLFMYNNLFYQSFVAFGLLTAGSAVCDNVFDHGSTASDAAFAHGYNAMIGVPPIPGGEHDIVLSRLDYVSGPFGDYYQAGSSLTDAGSRSAAATGLYHYTTIAGQAKEGDSQVDVGLHYVATRYQFDSQADFPRTQGAGPWFAQYALAEGNVVDYMAEYDETSHFWRNSDDYYCIVGEGMQHPGATYDSVRTFVAPSDGEIRLTSQAANAPYPLPTDGVKLRLLKNEETLIDWQPLSNGGPWWQTNLTFESRGGDAFHFQLNRQESAEGDTTVWRSWLSYENPEAQRTPWDTDGDGVPDYLEDQNGNGVTDGEETSYLLADSDGDGRSDRQEITDGTRGTGASEFLPVRLAHWNFNDASLVSDSGEKPMQAPAVTQTNSFDGLCLVFDRASSRALLRYRERRLGGTGVNFTVTNATFRFYYRPNWTSKIDRGPGPGATVCLLSIGDPDSASGGLTLTIDADGNSMGFACGNGRSPVLRLTAPTHFYSNTWYVVGLGISTKPGAGENRVIVSLLDAAVIDYSSPGGLPLPSASARLNGLCVGSRADGSQPAMGMLDELETFNYNLAEIGMHMNNYVIAARAAGPPSAVEFNWRRGANSINGIERRGPGGTDWTALGQTTGWSFADTNAGLPFGQRCDYRITPVGVVAGQSHITAGFNLPPAHYRGRALVLVDKTVAPSLAGNLSQFIDDLRGDGWSVSRFEVPRHNDQEWILPGNLNYARDVAAVKSLIQQEYAASAGELKSVILIGHVTIPYAGATAEDGHTEAPFNHSGAWPADIYYGDMDGVWTDTLVNYTNVGQRVLQNLPGDGKWDANNLVSPLEVAVGRIDFANLPAFAAPPGGAAPKTEEDLLNRYLVKNHRYRHRLLTLPNRAYVAGFYTGTSVQENHTIYESAAINYSRWFGFDSWSLLQGDCFTAKPCLWGFQVGHGGPTAINNGIGNVQHSTFDLANPANEPPVGFYMVGGSWFGDWYWGENSFMRALLATPNYGLAAVWLRQGVWRFETLGLGDTLGDGLLRTANDPTQKRSVRTTYLLGDPTLHINQLSPPGLLTAAANSEGGTRLAWRPSVDAGVRYYVYRATQSADGTVSKFTLLTETPVADLAYTDPHPPTGRKVYLVRATRSVASGCGSYANLSQGAMRQVE